MRASRLVPGGSNIIPYVAQPNYAAMCLRRQTAVMAQIEEMGGLEQICCPGKMVYPDPPWLVQPPQGRQFQNIDSIALPAANGTDTLVASFKVPTGYDGVITSVTNFWTGTGFVEGSGDLIWRIKIGRRWLRNFGVIDTTLGSLTSPCPLFRGGVRIYTQQVVEYWVNHANTSGLSGGRIVCGFFGWFYPM